MPPDTPDNPENSNPKKELHLPAIPYRADSQPQKVVPQNTGINDGILDFNAIKSQEVLAKVISARVSFLQNIIAEINAQIQERQCLKEQLNQDIDEKFCLAQTTIYELEQELCGKIDKSKRRISLENQLENLEKEKRQQELLHWQDTVKLKRELREAEKELQTALLDWWMVRFLS